jgi:hypothetical protein
MSKVSEFERGAQTMKAIIRRSGNLDAAAFRIGGIERISRSLRGLYEASCNGDLTPRQESRQRNLEKRAGELARELGAVLYLQTDPRGGTVYLIFPGDIPEGQTVSSCYDRGVFVA